MNLSKTKKITSILILLVLSLGVIQAFSTPVIGSIAVRMSSDETIDNSIAILESNLDNLEVLDFNSLEYAIEISRRIGPVIWVGHGNEQGIQTDKDLLSWEDFSTSIMRTASIDYVLSCYSDNLIKTTSISNNDAVTFTGEIDSSLGALLVSYAFNPTEKVIGDLVSYVGDLLTGQVEFNPLRLIVDGPSPPPPPPPPPPPTDIIWENPNNPGTGFTRGEMIIHIVVIIALIISLISLAAAAIFGTISATVGSILLTVANAALLAADVAEIFDDYYNNGASGLDVALKILGLVPDVVDIACDILELFGIATIIFTIAMWSEFTAKCACPPAWVITLMTALIAMQIEILAILKDFND